MYFNDQLPADADVAAYRHTLTNFSKLIEDVEGGSKWRRRAAEYGGAG